METNRVEAFSDGVLAIAITLLILEISVPHVRGSELGHALRHQWPSYAAYVVSFLTIGIMWVNHHALFAGLRSVDRNLLFLNLVLLMAIAFLPFPTALLAAYIRDDTGGTLAAAIYAGTMALIGLGFTALWLYLGRHPELRRETFTDEVVARGTRRTVFGPTAYFVAFLAAFVSAYATLVICAVVAIYFVIPTGSRTATSAR
jgi:uncharacterized membrane protein